MLYDISYGLAIIEIINDIHNVDFVKRLAKAPIENYPKILEHLMEIKKLLKSKEEK